MARRNAAVDVSRAGRQAQRRLRNVSGRIGQQSSTKRLDFCLACSRTDEHAIAPRAMHFLDHQIFQVGQGVFQILGVTAQKGRHIFQDGLFPEVELNHLRHIRVDRLVVGHAGANGVAQRHIATAVNVEQAGAAQR